MLMQTSSPTPLHKDSFFYLAALPEYYLKKGLKDSLADFIVKSLSRVQLFVTPWTAARQDPLSMGFSRQE